jgi:hypothetical protein
MRRTAPLVALAALVLAGCSRPVMPDAEYAKRTRAICGDAVRQVQALPTPRSDAEIGATVRRVRAINRHVTERIATLDTPRGARAEHRQDGAVDIGLRTDAAARRLLHALAKSPQPRRELERRRPALRRLAASETRAWSRARLRACAAGPTHALAEVGTGART